MRFFLLLYIRRLMMPYFAIYNICVWVGCVNCAWIWCVENSKIILAANLDWVDHINPQTYKQINSITVLYTWDACRARRNALSLHESVYSLVHIAAESLYDEIWWRPIYLRRLRDMLRPSVWSSSCRVLYCPNFKEHKTTP